MNSKKKGSNGERELLRLLEPYEAERHEQRYIGGLGNPDISFVLGGTLFHCECKRVERLNIHAAFAQASRDAQGGAVPVVAHRRNREPWLVTMKLDDFLRRDNAIQK